MEVESQSLHRHKINDIQYKTNVFSYFFVSLLSKNYITVQDACLVIGETASQPIIISSLFPILYYAYKIVCPKIFLMIHSLLYMLGYHKAVTQLTLGYHKTIVFSSSLSMHGYTCK